MIGILGGTFDPIHNGHLHIATQVTARLGLEQMQFMPCAMPVHRDRPRVSTADRCAMIKLAIAGRPGFTLNTLEVNRGGVSYSVDSLRRIRRSNESILVMVLGADAFNGFPDWKQPQQILQLAHIVVCHRPGFEVDAEIFRDHRVDSVDDLSLRRAGNILTLEVDAIDCSSTAIRAALGKGNMPERKLPPSVAAFIEHNKLYRKISE